MKLIEWPLVAGISNTLYGQGRYLRILSAEFPVTVKTDTNHDSLILGGIGFDLGRQEFDEEGRPFIQPFQRLDFISEQTQTIKILVSEFPTTDSRLTGDVDINGLISVVQSGGSTRTSKNVEIPAGVAVEVLAVDLNRIEAEISFNGAGRVGFDNTLSAVTGFPVTAGSSWSDKNTGAFWFYSDEATTVDVIEGGK